MIILNLINRKFGQREVIIDENNLPQTKQLIKECWSSTNQLPIKVNISILDVGRLMQIHQLYELGKTRKAKSSKKL